MQNSRPPMPAFDQKSQLALLRTCAAGALATLRPLLPRTFDEAAKRLAGDADSELHARSGRVIFLTRGREFIQIYEEELAEELDVAIDQYLSFVDSEATTHEGEPVIRGLDAFEQRILFERVTYRLSDPQEAQFRELGWRLATLRSVSGLPPRQNPLRAAVFFRAIVRTLIRLDVYQTAVLKLAQALDAPMAAPLREVYRETNRVLTQAGVSEHRRKAPPATGDFGYLTTRPSTFPGPRTDNELRIDTLPPSVDGPTHVAPVAVMPQVAGPAADVAPPEPAAADDGILLATSLAGRAGYELVRLDAGHPPSMTDIRKVAAGRQVSKSTRITVELVHAVFREVIDDPAVQEEFLNLILHLQIPILRTTLVHPDYVPTERAPGRTLVRRLKLASAGWTPAGEFNQRLIEAARAAVRPLVAASDLEPQQFHAALTQFVAFLAEEAKAPENRVENIRKAHAESEARKADEARLTLEIGRRIQQHSLPLHVRDFLLGPWACVLYLAREQAKTEPGYELPFENLVDALLLNERVKTDPQEGSEERAPVTQLLATIYRGIELIRMDPADVRELVRGLTAEQFAEAALTDPVPIPRDPD